jgi:hypothetical protein
MTGQVLAFERQQVEAADLVAGGRRQVGVGGQRGEDHAAAGARTVTVMLS